MNIVNIVCDEADDGWIYSKFISEIKKHSKYKIVVNEKDVNKYDILHYIPYYVVDARAKTKPSTCWLSHQEKKDPLKSKFLSAAKAVDAGISHSNKYAKWLREQGLDNVIQIIPGVDLDRFRIGGKIHKEKYPKLSVGYVGRQYTSSARKNPALLKEISNLDYVDFKTTGGKMGASQIPAFYQLQHLIVSPATIEGGPMCIQEALACGIPIICYDSVGVANEFNEGVIRVPYGDSKAFKKRLKEFWDDKQYEYYNEKAIQDLMREQVERQTWKKFVEEHDKIWNMITTKSWRKS